MIRTLMLGLLSVLVCAMPLAADPPVKRYFYVQVEPLQNAARSFSEPSAPDFARALEKALKMPYEKRFFFRKDDSSFTQIAEYGLFQSLQELIKPMVKQGETAKVRDFLQGITDAKMIQGYELSRRGGSFHVVLKLTVDRDGFWAFSTQYRQFRILDGYEGPTLHSSLGIRKTDR